MALLTFSVSMGKNPFWNTNLLKKVYYRAIQASIDSVPANLDKEVVSVIPIPAALTLFGSHNLLPPTPSPSLALFPMSLKILYPIVLRMMIKTWLKRDMMSKPWLKQDICEEMILW